MGMLPAVGRTLMTGRRSQWLYLNRLAAPSHCPVIMIVTAMMSLLSTSSRRVVDELRLRCQLLAARRR